MSRSDSLLDRFTHLGKAHGRPPPSIRHRPSKFDGREIAEFLQNRVRPAVIMPKCTTPAKPVRFGCPRASRKRKNENPLDFPFGTVYVRYLGGPRWTVSLDGSVPTMAEPARSEGRRRRAESKKKMRNEAILQACCNQKRDGRPHSRRLRTARITKNTAKIVPRARRDVLRSLSDSRTGTWASI